jgi:serine/threonine protein phosphatase 1
MKINVDTYRKVFLVGDLHGEITKLNDKLIGVGFDKQQDLLVSVGDLVDRGEDSLACLNLVYEDWFTCVKGNHEELMIRSVLEGDEQYVNCWIQNGGMWYFHSSPDERLEVEDICRLLNEEYTYELLLERNNKKVLITHGDYPLDFYNPSVKLSSDRIIWNRDRINTYKSYGWEQNIRDVDLAVFGHTPLRNVTRSGNCMWIDTGACFGKELAIVDLDEVSGL